MKSVAYLFAASLLTSAFVGLTACSDDSSGGGNAAGSSSGLFGGSAGSTGGTTTVDEQGGAAGTKTGTGGKGGKAGSTSQGAGGDDTFGGGGTDDPGTGGGGGTDPTGGGGTSSGQTCGECAQDQCTTELSTCQKNQACLAIDSCLGDCNGDATCQQKCLTDNPNGKDDYLAVNDCALDKCADACGGGGNGCSACAQSNCSAEVGACQNSADCQAFIKCLDDANCNDNTCYQACVESTPKGQAPFEAANNCVLDKCEAECQ